MNLNIENVKDNTILTTVKLVYIEETERCNKNENESKNKKENAIKLSK